MRRKLNNGMNVIMEWRELPIVALSITTPFGAGYEPVRMKGVAHFIEHLVFTGTKTRTHEGISREIEKRGGVLNAFTAQQATSYWCKLPSAHVLTGLEILYDILENPVFDPQKFEKEKKIILEEIKMYRDNAQHHVYDLLHAAMYAPPFGTEIIGSEKTIKGIKRDDVFQFYREQYAPSEYIVTLVGNADFEQVCAYLERAFPRRAARSRRFVARSLHRHVRETRKGIDQAQYAFGIHAPQWGTQEHYALEVLDAYLAQGMSSRLFLRIREELGLAYSIKSSLASERGYADYILTVGTTPESIPEVQRIILAEFLAAEEILAVDVKAAQERAIGLHMLHQEESVQVMGELMFAELAGKAEDYYNHEHALRTVSVADVRSVARIRDFSSAVIVPA